MFGIQSSLFQSYFILFFIYKLPSITGDSICHINSPKKKNSSYEYLITFFWFQICLPNGHLYYIVLPRSITLFMH